MSIIDLNLIAVLWSPAQQAFHYETVQRMLEQNRRICLEDKNIDYITLGFCSTIEEAQTVIDACRQVKSENNEQAAAADRF